MGVMTNFDIQAKRIGAILLCPLALNFSSPVLAQAEPTETVPQPPPSVEEFSLPPGDTTPPPQPVPTGPVDDTALPPIAAPEPVSPTPEPVETPENSDTAPATPVVTETQNSQSPAPASPTPQRNASPEPDRVQPSQQSQAAVPQNAADDEKSAPDGSAATDEASVSEQDELAEQSDRTLTAPAPTNVEQSSSQSTFLLISLLVAGLLAGLGFWIWRKKKIAEPIKDDDAVATSLEDSKNNNIVTEVEPATSPAPSEPIIEPGPDTGASSDGFVTTKIRKTETKPETRPVKAAISDLITIEFHAQSASSTLLNAVVGYELEIRNISEQQISDLHISGAMIQADKNLVETAASSQGQLLHEVGDLKAGEKERVSGDIRLPFTAFQPIDFQSQKLFVPLILLRFDYFDSEGNAQMRALNYLVGSEHSPPREKMAPFRLDLGPRSYGNVAHRPFQS